MSMRLWQVAGLAVFLGVAAIAGCSKSNPGPSAAEAAAAAKTAMEAKANKDLQLYDQMRGKESWDLAAALGAEIVAKYPDSEATAQIKQTLDDVRAKATAQTESRRLGRLWVYSAAPEKGGTQYAASIESTPPLSPAGFTGKDAKRVHLILRQHPQWGQNVYLMLDNDKFDCRSGCPSLAVSFDGGPVQEMKATIPPTGEPALFIDDDRAFIAKILRTKRVAIDVVLQEGGQKTLVFETGGLDMARLPGSAKKK